MTQLTLLETNALEEKYKAWVTAHPTVWALFERFALDMLVRRRRFGIGALTERVRWEIQTTWFLDAEGYKVNNNHRAYLARDLIGRYPEMAQYLETRKVKGEEERDG